MLGSWKRMHLPLQGNVLPKPTCSSIPDTIKCWSDKGKSCAKRWAKHVGTIALVFTSLDVVVFSTRDLHRMPSSPSRRSILPRTRYAGRVCMVWQYLRNRTQYPRMRLVRLFACFCRFLGIVLSRLGCCDTSDLIVCAECSLVQHGPTLGSCF